MLKRAETPNELKNISDEVSKRILEMYSTKKNGCKKKKPTGINMR